ncbi:MAG: NAD(P)H-hydrate dehydratase, partial [Gemmatimonadales bacterium]
NGGDGWVVARAFNAAGARVSVAETTKKRSPDCESNRALARAEGVDLIKGDVGWPGGGIVVDALLGTGASGAARGELGELANRVAEHPGPVVAIDGPTGLDLSTGEAHGPVRAHLTVTFGGPRRGHLLAREWCGRIVVVDIGFPDPAPTLPALFTDRDAASVLPPFEVAMHKGDRGRVLVVGGDDGMAGAALHAASAAFAAGAGLVKIAAAAKTADAAQSRLPDALSLVTALGPECEDELRDAIAWADTVVLGPGLGRGEKREAFVRAVLNASECPVVVDADAIKAGRQTTDNGRRIFTPHLGEFRSAFPELAEEMTRDRFAVADAAAEMFLAGPPDFPSFPPTVLLKGVPTLIAQHGHPLRVVATGNPALATGGSGDLLAGFIGAYLARGLSDRDAAALGAYTLGRGAELAAAHHTVRATRPADVLAALPEVWRMLERGGTIEPPVLCELPVPALV